MKKTLGRISYERNIYFHILIGKLVGRKLYEGFLMKEIFIFFFMVILSGIMPDLFWYMNLHPFWGFIPCFLLSILTFVLLNENDEDLLNTFMFIFSIVFIFSFIMRFEVADTTKTAPDGTKVIVSKIYKESELK